RCHRSWDSLAVSEAYEPLKRWPARRTTETFPGRRRSSALRMYRLSMADIGDSCRSWSDPIGCPPSEWPTTKKIPIRRRQPLSFEAPWGGMRSIYETMGGADAVLALAEAWHGRCLADPILSHPFAREIHPQHTERLAAYW